MPLRFPTIFTLVLILGTGSTLALPRAAADEAASTVAAIKAKHDRALVLDLVEHLRKNPKADDLEQGFMALFDKVIEHDWFTEFEPVARDYLAAHSEGAVRPLARIVATMARAQAGAYTEALASYRELLAGLSGPEQEEFAASFTDSLASAAIGAGEYEVARQTYQELLKKYGESPTLRQKIEDDLARLAKVGKPAPRVLVADIVGQSIRLEDYRGKYLLIDFWATWCAPCITELPRLQAAYARYHDRGFEILGVSLDETKPPVIDFVKTRKLPWRQVHNASSGSDLVDAFGVSNIPATFLIGPDGTIVRLELRGPALDEALAKLIK